MRRIAAFLLTASVCLSLSTAVLAQGTSESSPAGFGGGLLDQFDPRARTLAASPATVSAQIAPATSEHPPVLVVTARIADGKYAYSITQERGGPMPSRITIDKSADYRLSGPFVADPEPSSHVEDGPVWKGLTIEQHEGQVQWYAPLEITTGNSIDSVAVRGSVMMQVCEKDGTCEPVDKSFTAKLAENLSVPSTVASRLTTAADRTTATDRLPPQDVVEYQPQTSAVKLSGQLSPSIVRPGGTALLELTAKLPEGGRLYARADRDEKFGTKPVLIAIEDASGLVPHRASTQAPVKVDTSVPQFGDMQYHEGQVTWTMRIDVPREQPDGEYPIIGLFGYQACEYGDGGQNVCELPQAVRFETTLQVGDESAAGALPVNFAMAEGYPKAADAANRFADFLEGQYTILAADAAQRDLEDSPALRSSNQYDLALIDVEEEKGSLGYFIALAFVGGLILNLMPCVLPVIGLKVMSFVEQAGKSRAHALVLNLWYAFGIVSVFLLLGILAASIGLGWGGQFGNTSFNVTISAIVFAMALSLLGVWEVPIPGFFGSGSVQSAAAQEGPTGAFLKGVVTTVLATPCTAPFMAAAVAWAVSQSLATTLVVFASLGIGMASPYILVGVFPELLRFLPKPGAWMETFKQISGFVLLGTVVFILSFMEPAAVVPTIALLTGIGIACWLVGRTPMTVEIRDRLQAWGYAVAIIMLFVGVSFGWLYSDVMLPRFANQAAAPVAAHGPWQPFSLERLKQQAVDAGKTVLVDFSADWCFNCKVLEQAVLHSEPVEQAIAESEVVTMYADFTDYPAEIAETIRALRANGVPVIAVFPGDEPYRPIVFRGGYTQQGLIDALEKATGRRLQSSRQSLAEVSQLSLPMN